MMLDPHFEAIFGEEYPNEKSEDGGTEVIAMNAGMYVNDTWVPIHNISWLIGAIKKFYIVGEEND